MAKEWMQICYFVKFEKNGKGIWTKKYVDDEENMTVIRVGKSISYDELYEKVIEKLEIDSMVYELEIRCESPTPYAELPMKIECDESVEWLLVVCDAIKLNITLKKKVVGNEEPNVFKSVDSFEEIQNVVIDDDSRDACGIGGDSLEFNRTEENENVVIDDYNGDNYCPGEKSHQGGVAAVDPLLSLLGEDVVLDAWEPNNIHDDVLDTDSDDSSDDGNFVEDALENTHIGDTLGGNNNGSNSHEGPIVKSTGSLHLIPSHPDSHHVSSVRIPVNLDICENELFVSKDDLIQKLEMMALKSHFEFKQTTSTRSVYVARCVVEQCGWRVRATKIHTANTGSSSSANMSEFFQVRIYKGNHSCSLTVRKKDHKHASYKFIGKHYLHKFRDVSRIYRTKDITSDFKNDFDYTILKGKANKARKFARELIHGKATESYEKLPKYCYMLKVQNPGTKTSIRTDKDTDRFQYFFMALGVCISGFQSSIRRVIAVDGTHLKSKFEGVLVVATCQDANLMIYPLAWGIVDSENNESWTWFFRKLRKITGDTDELVIVSDRALSIKRGFENVFKNAHHGFCTYHMKCNLETKFPRCGIGHMFWRASEAYTETEFEMLYTALYRVKPPDDDGVYPVKAYLDRVPLRYWSRAHSVGLRYNMMTTKNAESLNSLFLCARVLCIVSLIEEIRSTLQRWFAERRKLFIDCHTFLTKPFEEKMVRRYSEAADLILEEVSDPQYAVRNDLEVYVVDLGELKCSCKVFDLDKFPCAHVIPAAKENSKNGYDYCSPYYTAAYWRQSYSEAVYPLITDKLYDFPDKVLGKKVLAPLVDKNQSGRPPSKKRKKSARERRGKKCGCNQNERHDIRTCPALVDPPP